MTEPEHNSEGRDAIDKLNDPMADNVNAIAQLHARAEGKLSRHQRVIEQLTTSLGRPGTIWVMVGLMALWIALNLAVQRLGIRPLDRWPFSGLQLLISIAALIVATMILITENRQSKMAERRAHLDLQISLVAEQKITKLIALIEELRRDMPNVHDRTDPEADAMQMPSDPHMVSSALEFAMDEAVGDALNKEGQPEDDDNGKPKESTS